MKEKIGNILNRTDKFLCVEIYSEGSDKTYRALEITKKKNNLSLTDSYVANDFDSLLRQIPKNSPTILSFSGQSIITKSVENSSKYRASILFNANVEDFYWYEIPQANDIYVSVMRKQLLFDEIELFEAAGISIVDVSIGPFVATALKPLLTDESSILTPNFQLNFDQEKLSGFAKRKISGTDTEQYTLGEEIIGVMDIVPFSSLLGYLYPDSSIETDKEFLKSKRQEFKYKKAFNKVGAIGLTLLLVTLLVSYLMLGYYQKEYMELQVQLGEENIAFDKLTLLELDQTNKEAILRESGLTNSRFLAYYVSEITKKIPSEISLVEMTVFPPTAKVTPKERIYFHNNLIQISGTVSSNQSFTSWIQKLKKTNWVESLEIIDFVKDGGVSSFEIKLTLRLHV